MAADKQNLQDAFLNHVRKAKVPVTIFLINGVKLQGVITWFDNFCVLLRRDGQSQLVYKHAISTIMPGAPISNDQLKMLAKDNVVADGAAGLADLGISATPMAAVAPRYLSAFRKHGRFGTRIEA